GGDRARAPPPRAPPQECYALHVRRVREHVHRLRTQELAAELAEQLLDVARQRGRVARDIDEPRRADPPESAKRFPGEPGSRRVDYDHVRVAAALVQLVERLADVAGEEGGVRDPVEICVLERAGDGLLGAL